MLDAKYVSYLQRNGISDTLLNDDAISFPVYIRGVQNYLSSMLTTETFNWDEKRRSEFREQLILRYVLETPKKVAGYYREDEILTDDLLDAVYNKILHEDILTPALQDEDINEIQVNHYDGAIFVEKAGHYVPYLDKNGNPYKFASNSDFQALITKMMDDGSGDAPRTTMLNALVNGRTAKQYYRVSLVHESVITRDLAPYDQSSMTMTLRKFKKQSITMEMLVRGGTCSWNMGWLLALIGVFNGKAMTVGATASGKTTLLGIICGYIPNQLRTILCQNPTEIMLTKRDVNGRILNNVIHWESKDVPAGVVDEGASPTMANLITHALRNSPQLIVVGEMRAPEEFRQAFRAITTGHRVLGTFHAANPKEAISRCVQELGSSGGVQSDISLRGQVAEGIDIFISQEKLMDGSRKITSITELTGELDERGYPVLNELFRFVYDGKTDFDEKGKVKKIHGRHIRVGIPTDRLIQKMYSSGVTTDELSVLLAPLSDMQDELYLCEDGDFDLDERRRVQAEARVHGSKF